MNEFPALDTYTVYVPLALTGKLVFGVIDIPLPLILVMLPRRFSLALFTMLVISVVPG